jgi:hypothetical protein
MHQQVGQVDQLAHRAAAVQPPWFTVAMPALS